MATTYYLHISTDETIQEISKKIDSIFDITPTEYMDFPSPYAMYQFDHVNISIKTDDDDNKRYICKSYNISTNYIFYIDEFFTEEKQYLEDIIKFLGLVMCDFPGDCILTTEGGMEILIRKCGRITYNEDYASIGGDNLLDFLGLAYEIGQIESFDNE